MKVLKKILTCVLILSMSMGVMSVTAFADEGTGSSTSTNTGSITITNATLDQNYAVYKVFNATYAKEGDGVSYTLDPDNTQFNALLFEEDGTPTV